MKDEFFASYLKKKNSTPLKNRLTDYYQNEERNANADNYPSVHMTLQQ